MQKLDLTATCIDTPRDDPEQPFTWLVHDYLAEDSQVSTENVATMIMDKVQVDPRDDVSYFLAEDILLFARFIPPEHPSFQRQLDMVVGIYSSDRWPATARNPLEMLCWQFRDSLNVVSCNMAEHTNDWDEKLDIDDKTPDQEYRNYLAFHIHCSRVLGLEGDDPAAWLVGSFRRGLEGSSSDERQTKEGDLYAAAEFILIDGNHIYQFVVERHNRLRRGLGSIFEAHLDKLEEEGMSQSDLIEHRWQFWKDRFQAISFGQDSSFHCSEEGKRVAAKAFARMKEIEAGPVDELRREIEPS